MSSLEKKIRSYSHEALADYQNECKIKEAVQRSKKAFCESETEHFLSYPEFIYQQGRYIHKRWWVLQGLILAALWWILQITESNIYIQRSMGIIASLFVILIVPEFWKNRSSASAEIECTAYYSLRQVYAARMIIFAAVDLLLLSSFFAAVSVTGRLTVGEILIQFFIPFNVTCCICFRTLCSTRLGSEYMALLFCMVWVAIWVLILLDENIYAAVSVPIWGGLLAASILYLGYSIRKMQKCCEIIWEVNPSWN